MFEFKMLLVFGLLLVCCIDFSRNAALSNIELKKYKHLIEGQGLYTPEDDITILTAGNYKELLYGQKHGILVEFYNSWCGFCQRFAPSWKALGSDIKRWKDMIKIAAMDCSDEENSPICREFEIMAYPTLRYFHENVEEGNIGDEVKKGEDVYSHVQNLMMKLIDEQREGRGGQFPDLLPYMGSQIDKGIFKDLTPSTKFVFLIQEQADSLLGPQVVLDVYDVPDVAIKYALNNNTALYQSANPNFATLYVVTNDGDVQLLGDGLNTRDSIKVAVRNYLKQQEIDVPEVTTKEIFTGKWIEADIPDMGALMEAREHESLKKKIKAMGDVVIQGDLETALRNSLKHEVALFKTISGEKREALIKYLRILAKYFPFGPRGKQFLNELKDSVTNAGNVVNGADIANLVEKAENDKVFSSPAQWLACSGSTSRSRGYPCGLWKMFHLLTVAAADQNANTEGAYSREVLDAMHGYIKNFFGCSECSRHFQQMAVDKDMQSVESLDSAIIWLWMAHNTVNKRLSGDSTEDREFPKVQFPLPERCPACRKADNAWEYAEVLRYLKHVYGVSNIRYIGSDTNIFLTDTEGHSDGNGSSTYFFKKVDVSMYFVLYLGSFILIVMLIRMFLKRGYKKKMYVHDLLGKV